MGLLHITRQLFKKRITGMSILATVGSLISRRFFRQKQERLEKLQTGNLEEVLDYITVYDVARGAGKLLAGWLQDRQPGLEIAQADEILGALLNTMDAQDENPLDKARNRLLISKALFYLEGFHWRTGYYEKYQNQARSLLKKIPEWKNISTQAVFKAEPYTAEELIGTTHRMLFSLSDAPLADYITQVLETETLNSDVDYMSRLIALTFGLEDDVAFGRLMTQWLKDYRDFKLRQAKQQEKWVDTSLSVINGDLPTQLGWKWLPRIWPDQNRPAKTSD